MNRGLLDLAIAGMGGLKPRERCVLASALFDERELKELDCGRLGALLGRRLPVSDWDVGLLLDEAKRVDEQCGRCGVQWVGYGDEAYPPLLRELHDPPVVLYRRGALPRQDKPMVAVVGTREATQAGARAALDLGYGLAQAGVQLVSGLARGIDAFAHRGALEAPAPNWAVLASGLDAVFPVSNRQLARRILELGGGLLSEYPPGTEPRTWHFPARNRIIAGLARATVVVEAPEKSGALITADFALEGGRELWVHAAALESRRGAGARALRDQGAPVAGSAADVIRDWMIPRPPTAAQRKQ